MSANAALEPEERAAANDAANDDFEVISVYTRKNALDDGILVDITTTAAEAGFTVPVAMTRTSWGRCVQWSEADTARTRRYQDQAGRLWDVVWMAACAMRSAVQRGDNGAVLRFKLYVVPIDKGGPARLTELKVMIGPGDAGEPVATIMETDED